MRIGLTSIYVDDQDRAEEFYTHVLGFQVKTNAAYGPGERWLSVVAPRSRRGVELVLHVADEPARAFQQASRQLGPAGAVAAGLLAARLPQQLAELGVRQCGLGLAHGTNRFRYSLSA